MPRHLIASDASIRSVKAGDPRQRLTDGDGLYLLLHHKGRSHAWRIDYTYRGRRKTLSLGTYPDTGLALARQQADEVRRQVREGVDPSAARQASKDEQRRSQDEQRRADQGLPPARSFEAVAREWLATVHRVNVSPQHADRTQLRLEQDIFPWLGRSQIATVEPPDLLACLRRIEARGAIETAHRAKDACGQVFRYGIAAGYCTRNPAADLRDALRPVKAKHYAAIVAPVEAGRLLRAIEGYTGQPVTRAALRLTPHLMLRPGELRHMEWSWIDRDRAMLTIPAATMKRSLAGKCDGPPHLVPLSLQALAVLDDLRPLTGHGRFVFPSELTGERCMSENTVRGALRRMGYSNEEMTAHGFRAMARTMIAERLGTSPEVIEAQLAHEVRDSLGRAYNRTQFLDARVTMMQAWSDYIDQLRRGAEVVPIGRAAA